MKKANTATKAKGPPARKAAKPSGDTIMRHSREGVKKKKVSRAMKKKTGK